MRNKIQRTAISLLAVLMLSGCSEGLKEQSILPLLQPSETDAPCVTLGTSLHSTPDSITESVPTEPKPIVSPILSSGDRDMHQISSAVFAESADDGIFTYNLYNLYAEVIGFSPRYKIDSDSPTALAIPEQYNDLPVRAVAADAFSAECGILLKSITLPEGLWQIGARAFQNQTNLISVNLPDSILYVGEQAFVCRDSEEEYTPALFLNGILITPDGKAFTNEKRFDASR